MIARPGTAPGRSGETVVAQGFPTVYPRRPLVVKHLGPTSYTETFAAMRAFTLARDADTVDEIWFTEHEPVYTLGLAGKPAHVLNPRAIPVVQADRGGQVTYHGPGQLIGYLLLDLKRRDLKVRELVRLIEDAVIATLADFGVAGHRRAGMPGVYVGDANGDTGADTDGDADGDTDGDTNCDIRGGAKIAALGLKVKNGCSYHGVSLNVDMDLAPFAGINPCGYENLEVTQLKAIQPPLNRTALPAVTVAALAQRLAVHLTSGLSA